MKKRNVSSKTTTPATKRKKVEDEVVKNAPFIKYTDVPIPLQNTLVNLKHDYKHSTPHPINYLYLKKQIKIPTSATSANLQHIDAWNLFIIAPSEMEQDCKVDKQNDTELEITGWSIVDHNTAIIMNTDDLAEISDPLMQFGVGLGDKPAKIGLFTTTFDTSCSRPAGVEDTGNLIDTTNIKFITNMNQLNEPKLTDSELRPEDFKTPMKAVIRRSNATPNPHEEIHQIDDYGSNIKKSKKEIATPSAPTPKTKVNRSTFTPQSEYLQQIERKTEEMIFRATLGNGIEIAKHVVQGHQKAKKTIRDLINIVGVESVEKYIAEFKQ